MRKQLQHTTIAVLLLLAILGGSLYLVESTTLAGDHGTVLTAATVVTQTIDCDDVPPKNASALEKQEYDEQCNDE